jgi:hypothetical protein
MKGLDASKEKSALVFVFPETVLSVPKGGGVGDLSIGSNELFGVSLCRRHGHHQPKPG